MQETLIGPHILINKEYVKLNYKDRDYNQKRLFLQGKTEKLERFCNFQMLSFAIIIYSTIACTVLCKQ